MEVTVSSIEGVLAETFDRIAAVYDRGRQGWYKGVLKLLQGKVLDPLLDAGCGTGYIACRLAGLGLSYVVCLDLSNGMLRTGRRRAYRWHVDSRVDFVQASVTMLPFRERAFRSVLALAVLHHVPTREGRLEALRESKRVCKGFILVAVWSALHPSNILRVISSLSRDVYVQWRRGNYRYYHLYLPFELAGDLTRAGYKGFKLYLWDYKPVIFKRNIVVEYFAGDP